jgi:predicted DNA binding CopG/RHH family protein
MQNTKENNEKNISSGELIALSNEFDNYDIVEHLAESEPAEFEVQLNRRQFRLEKSLAERITRISQKRGISPETYVNLVLQEKVLEEENL